jgi:hypothetical protein
MNARGPAAGSDTGPDSAALFCVSAGAAGASVGSFLVHEETKKMTENNHKPAIVRLIETVLSATMSDTAALDFHTRRYRRVSSTL